MSTLKKIVSDAVVVGFTQAATRAGGLISLPVLTKTYGAELYGLWVQVILINSLLAPIVALRLETACIRFLASASDKKQLAANFYAILLAVASSGALFAALGLAFNKQLSRVLFSDPQYHSFITGAFCWLLARCLFLVLNTYFRATQRTRTFALFNFAGSWSEIALVFAGAMNGFPLLAILFASIAKELIVSLAILLVIARELGLCVPNLQPLKLYLTYTLPLIPNTALLWVVNASDRFLINHYIGLSASGVYSVSYSVSSVIILLYTPLTLALFPAVSMHWDRGESGQVRKLFGYSLKLFLALAVPAAAGLVVLSRPLLSVLTSGEFVVGAWLVLSHCAAICLFGVYQITLYGIHLVRKTRYLTLIFLLAALVNFVLNVIFIPRFGILGAGVSTLAAYLGMTCLVCLWSRKEISFPIDWVFIFKCLAAGTVMAVVVGRIEAAAAVVQVLLAVVAGIVVYTVCLLLFNAFSEEEKRHLLAPFRKITGAK